MSDIIYRPPIATAPSSPAFSSPVAIVETTALDLSDRLPRIEDHKSCEDIALLGSPSTSAYRCQSYPVLPQATHVTCGQTPRISRVRKVPKGKTFELTSLAYFYFLFHVFCSYFELNFDSQYEESPVKLFFYAFILFIFICHISYFVILWLFPFYFQSLASVLSMLLRAKFEIMEHWNMEMDTHFESINNNSPCHQESSKPLFSLLCITSYIIVHALSTLGAMYNSNGGAWVYL